MAATSPVKGEGLLPRKSKSTPVNHRLLPGRAKEPQQDVEEQVPFLTHRGIKVLATKRTHKTVVHHRPVLDPSAQLRSSPSKLSVVLMSRPALESPPKPKPTPNHMEGVLLLSLTLSCLESRHLVQMLLDFCAGCKWC